MTQGNNPQLEAFGDYLATRRNAILLAWRNATEADPEQMTARALTRGQFNDHIPEVLDAFERKLRSRAGGAGEQSVDIEKKQEEVKHGLHRWQQGYRLLELMHEWGHLQHCLFDELAVFATTQPGFDRETMAAANRQIITLVNEAIGESAAQYERMQQAEAAGQYGALMGALAGINEIERRRAALIHQAVHDLNNDVFGVKVAAGRLGEADIAQAERAEFATLVQQGVQSVTAMLGELMELARLEAGQECREISGFDAGALVNDLCDINRPVARAHGLFLKVNGAPRLSVDGDPGKVRRLLQNLVSNALKYTQRGGVTVSWGKEKKNWWLMVKDTGPGVVTGPAAPMLLGLKAATASARESDEKVAEAKGGTSHVLAPPSGFPKAERPRDQPTGEGIGLSIVKRLCELLDASLEMASSPETGTTFRIVLPCRYKAPAP
jgi:signal transduction histidine kinase